MTVAEINCSLIALTKLFVVFHSAEVIRVTLPDIQSLEHLHPTLKLRSYVRGTVYRSHKFVRSLSDYLF
jgi:hypothetical protein